eukprot:3234028-Prorocentrum_lima.AAC.1
MGALRPHQPVLAAALVEEEGRCLRKLVERRAPVLAPPVALPEGGSRRGLLLWPAVVGRPCRMRGQLG